MLAPVLDPFHGAADQTGGERDEEILGIELAAIAEAAADIVLDQGDGVFAETDLPRQDAAVEERDLGRAPDGQMMAHASHSASTPRGSIVTAVWRCTLNRSRRVYRAHP